MRTWSLRLGVSICLGQFKQQFGFDFLFIILAGLPGLSAAAGIAPRQENTTLQMPVNPSTYSYRLDNAFPNLEFNDPVIVVAPPGANNELFVVEEAGRIILIKDLNHPTRTVFMDISDRVAFGSPEGEGGTLGLAFHPGYATNGLFFVYYICNTSTATGSGRHDRLSRFTRSRSDPNHGDPSSEVVLFTQYDEEFNHNGGTLLFGPDGYLYVTLGDEGYPDDVFDNAQRIDKDFFSAVLRLDVDHRPLSLPPNPHGALGGHTNYWIPRDNPFVHATSFNGRPVDPAQVRTEFWAVGVRSPWRMYWDFPTGNIYLSDVGEIGRVNDHSEEINLIVAGGNYGWPYREADTVGPKAAEAPPGFDSLPPLLTYPRGVSGPYVGRAAIAGVVYRGSELPALNDAFIFGDYFSGNIWMLRHSGYAIQQWQFLTAEPQGHIVSFGTDPRNGGVLVCDVLDDQVKRLVNVPESEAVPPTLAETGAFADTTTLTPAPGVVPYDVNVPFWSDGASKRRWFSIPHTADKIVYNASAPWQFPPGTVWIKHFDLETVAGDPSSARRVETRLLVRNESGIYGVTYEWNDSQDNAVAVPGEGKDKVFFISDSTGTHPQTWHFPARNECNSCHTPVAGYALGFNTAQLNRNFNYGSGAQNQIRAMAAAGYFTRSSAGGGPALASPSNPKASLSTRVKSYLAANCAQCHQPGGSARGNWDARFNTPLARSGVVSGGLANTLGSPANRVVAPRSPEHSVLLQRISSLDPAVRMPPLATTVLDQESIDLITQWINSLPARHQPLAARITYPRTAVSKTPIITVRGTAAGDNLARVIVAVNGGGEQEASGATSWSADVTLQPGSNTILVYAVDAEGNRSRPARRLFKYRAP